MLGLIGLVKPMAHIMLFCILCGTLGYLAVTAISVLGAELLLIHLGLSHISIDFQILAIVMVFCAIARGFLRYLEQTCGHYIAFSLLAIIRDHVFSALRRLCPAKLEGRDRGDLINIITSDIELLEVFYAHTIAPICIGFLASLVMTVSIGTFNVALGVLAAISYVAIGLVLPLLSSKKSKLQAVENRNQLGSLNSYFLESLRGINETMQYKCCDQRMEQIKSQTEQICNQQKAIKMHEGSSSSMAAALVSIFTIMMLFLNVALGSDFATTIITCIMLLFSFGPTLALANLSAGLSNTLASGERVLSLLEEEPICKDVILGKTPEFNGVQVEHLDFKYKQEQVLSDINCQIEKGSIVAITGPSGCGKSTLLKLLLRFWPVEDNNILISNTPINNIQTDHLRNMQALMTQEADLFQGSIRDNIAIAKPDASLEEVIVAAKAASIHDFICTLPQEYDTLVAELGSSLSGGEKQRISLARVFLHNADLILLDEPTSNLDSLNEGIILKSLQQLKGQKTIVMVSHRASSVSFATNNIHLN